ncbi:MAG: hypothetical protein ACI8QZ_001358 [Chlamydiales bacterium]|jgi:hypothetical protein
MVVYRAHDVPHDAPDLAITLAADDLSSARISGRLHGADGKPCSVRVKVARQGNGGWPLEILTGTDGTFEIGPLVPGEYSLLADSPPAHDQRLLDFSLALDEQRILGRRDVVGCLPVDLRVSGHDGFDPFDAVTFLPETPPSGEAPLSRSTTTFDANEFDSMALLPGDYRVRAGGPGTGLTSVLFELQVDTTRLELDPRPGYGVRFDYRLPERPHTTFLRVHVRDADDVGLQSWALIDDQRTDTIGDISLTPGSYTVEMLDRDGEGVERAFEVTPGPEQILELVLK